MILIEIYKKTEIALWYYRLKGKHYDTAKQAGDQLKQDNNIDFAVLQQVFDEGHALQKSIIKEAKKRKK